MLRATAGEWGRHPPNPPGDMPTRYRTVRPTEVLKLCLGNPRGKTPEREIEPQTRGGSIPVLCAHLSKGAQGPSGEMLLPPSVPGGGRELLPLSTQRPRGGLRSWSSMRKAHPVCHQQTPLGHSVWAHRAVCWPLLPWHGADVGSLLLPRNQEAFRGAKSSTEGQGASHMGPGRVRQQGDGHHCLFKQARFRWAKKSP